MGVAYTIFELSEHTGVKPRTVRYYISLGLLSGPVTQGCTAQYSEQHLIDLRHILDLKKAGMSLGQIRDVLIQGDVCILANWRVGYGSREF